jgi:hypothetical protein
MNLFNTAYDVYSHSYLCYGQEQLRLVYQAQLIQQANGSTLIDDPCLQSGFNQPMNYSMISSSVCATQRYPAPTGIIGTTTIVFR